MESLAHTRGAEDVFPLDRLHSEQHHISFLDGAYVVLLQENLESGRMLGEFLFNATFGRLSANSGYEAFNIDGAFVQRIEYSSSNCSSQCSYLLGIC